jgi:hypothetical protein
MRAIHQGLWTLAVLAVAAAPAAAQGRRDSRSIEESIERTVEAAAELVGENIERWAEAFERNAERWAQEIERQAEQLAARVEARVEASEQQSDRERELRERQRELERQQREIQRELDEARREAQREEQERARERQQEQRERQRNQGNQGNQRQEFTEQFSRTVRLGRDGVIDLETIAGDIIVTGGGGGDVRIDAVKRIRHANEDQAKSLLSQVRVDVFERPGRVQIRASFPPLRNGGGTVDYTLAVPSDADRVLKTGSGDVRVTNVNGELRTETVSGDLQITGAEGNVVAAVVSGDLVIRDVRSRSLRLNSVSGDIVASAIEVERADIGTVNGDIEYSGRLARTGRYELHTHAGEITVAPTNTPGFQVDATTFSGDITSAFQLTTGPSVQRGFNNSSNRTLRGTFGDAGPALVLRTFNGDISIVRR